MDIYVCRGRLGVGAKHIFGNFKKFEFFFLDDPPRPLKIRACKDDVLFFKKW